MENKNKSNVFLVIVLLVVILVLGGYIVYDKVLKSNDGENQDKDVVDKQPEKGDNAVYMTEEDEKDAKVIYSSTNQKIYHKEIYYSPETKFIVGGHTIYGNDKKQLFKVMHEDNTKGSIYKDYIYLATNNTVKKYDFDGKVISTKAMDGTIKDIILNNAIIIKDNTLIIQNIETLEKITVVKLESKFKYMNGGYAGNKEWVHLDYHDGGPCIWENHKQSKEDGIVLYIFITDRFITDTDGTEIGGYVYTITDSNQVITDALKGHGQCF